MKNRNPTKKSIEIYSAKRNMFEHWICYLFFNRTSIENPWAIPTLEIQNNDTHAMSLEFSTNQGHETSTNVFWRTYNHKRIWRATWTGVCSFIRERGWKMRWNDRISCLVLFLYEFALSRDVPPCVKSSTLRFEYPHEHLLSCDRLVHENINDGFVQEEKSVLTHFNCFKRWPTKIECPHEIVTVQISHRLARWYGICVPHELIPSRMWYTTSKKYVGPKEGSWAVCTQRSGLPRSYFVVVSLDL